MFTESLIPKRSYAHDFIPTDSKDKKKNSDKPRLLKLNLLLQNIEDELKLTQEQVASLLACAFFGMLPEQKFHQQRFGNPNFFDLFKNPSPAPSNTSTEATATTTSTADAAADEEKPATKKNKKANKDENIEEAELLKRNQYAKLKCLLHYFQRVIAQRAFTLKCLSDVFVCPSYT